MATDSAFRRPAMKASTSADAWSSHCSSSIRSRQRTFVGDVGKQAEDGQSRPRTGPEAAPRSMPNAVRSASRCGAGRSSRRPSIGAHNWCSVAKASSISDSTPAARSTRQSRAACSARRSNRALLPTPASPCSTSARLSPLRTEFTICSSVAHSASLPKSFIARRRYRRACRSTASGSGCRIWCTPCADAIRPCVR